MVTTKDDDSSADTPSADGNAGRTAPGAGSPPTPTLDDVEQGEQALALLDDIYDAAQDEAIDRVDGPISPAAHRLANVAHQMVDDLPRHILAYRRAKAERAGQGIPSDGRPVDPIDATALDTARIRAMPRPQLEHLVSRLQRIRGDPSMVTFDGLTDEELREVARRLRPEQHAER